jgi:hypothetical protein
LARGLSHLNYELPTQGSHTREGYEPMSADSFISSTNQKSIMNHSQYAPRLFAHQQCIYTTTRLRWWWGWRCPQNRQQHKYNNITREPLFSFLLICSAMFYSLLDVYNPSISDRLLFTFSLRLFSFSICSFFSITRLFLYFYCFTASSVKIIESCYLIIGTGEIARCYFNNTRNGRFN